MERQPNFRASCQIDNECRRSVSIFSRRGTITSTPKTSSLYAAMADSTPGTKQTASPTSPRKSSWFSKLRYPSKNQEGTVLHAVPPRVAAHSMSALDIAMAVSPNEEILQAIGKKSSVSTSPSASPLNNCGSGPGSRSHGVFDSRIGVWRDGVALWDVEKKAKRKSESTLHIPTTTPSPPKVDRACRPRLSVRIPNSKLQQILGDDAPIPPQPSKPARVTPATPADTSRRSSSSQTTSLDQSSIHPAFRTSSPGVEAQRSEAKSVSSRGNSRSSVSSNTLFQDDIFDIVSCYSRHSSMTSVEAESPNETAQHSHWNYLDVPKRSASAAFSITDPVKAGIFDEASGDSNVTSAPSESQYLQVTSPPNHRAPSPTFSEAVYDLQQQLSTISERLSATPTDDDNLYKTFKFDSAVDNMSRAPTLPKKSRKRQWVKPAHLSLSQPLPAVTDVPVRHQSVPTRKQQSPHDHEDDVRRVSSVRCMLSPDIGSMWLSWSASSAKKSPALTFDHEALCLKIMAHSASFEDLKSLSMVNKTTRKCFENNKLRLMKSTLFNESPPAWELRELSPFPFGNFMPTDFLDDTEISPSAYMSCTVHDRLIVRELKSIIVTKCQSFIRPETVSSLMTEGSTRFDDAIYRVWSFCKMFGCDRGRENDVKGQTDWLKGGILAHQKGCAATLSFGPEIEVDGILLNAPEHFAAGNGSGLSAEQLYDMSEIWECLYALMQPYEGETSKAQSCGVFRHTGGGFMDPMVQGRVVEEWIAYILSLGPSVVLELARFDDTSAGLDFAHLNDWTDWTPPQSGMTRRRFFREPVSQLYEERLLASTADTQSKDITKTLLRKRQTAEMNLAYRQMSLRSRKIDEPTCALSRHDSALAPEVHKKPISRRLSTPTSPRSPSTNSTVPYPVSWSPRKVSPIIEHRVDTFNRLSMLSFEGLAEDTSGLAIGKIMDIGFSNAQAREALRITDMGSGLRVDRAVDWLLRQNRF